ncbi:MAG: hypothetical protein WC196_03790 [Bacilli bacterium]|nr:hypothetical protein [Bacilli bacterium]
MKRVDYSFIDIRRILDRIRYYVKEGSFSIALNKNREKNLQFIREYELDDLDKCRSLLLNVSVFDFCYSTSNYHKGYENEVLYVFCPEVHLVNILEIEKKVKVYIKIKMLHDGVLVISFH